MLHRGHHHHVPSAVRSYRVALPSRTMGSTIMFWPKTTLYHGQPCLVVSAARPCTTGIPILYGGHSKIGLPTTLCCISRIQPEEPRFRPVFAGFPTSRALPAGSPTAPPVPFTSRGDRQRGRFVRTSLRGRLKSRCVAGTQPSLAVAAHRHPASRQEEQRAGCQRAAQAGSLCSTALATF